MKTLQKPKLLHSPGLVLTTIVLMTVALVQIFPFYWMLTFSLKSNADIYGGNIAGLPCILKTMSRHLPLGTSEYI